MSFRDIRDVENMINVASQHKKAVVIGAGLLGLEAAMGLCGRGMEVTVVHNSDIPLNRQLDQEAGELLKHALQTRGLHFKMNASTQSIQGNVRVEKVCFADGSELEADLVIMAIGIRPNIQLAKDSGLYCKNGIVVSDTLQTYDPCIYALGECIEHRGDTFGLVAPLYDQAKVLANHLSEHGVAQFQTLPTATKLKVTGVNLFSVGNFLGTPSSEYLYYRHTQQGIYKKIVIENNQIIGVVLYGDTQEGPFYHSLLDEQTNIESIRPYLMFGKALCQAQSDTMTQSKKRANHDEVAA
ncbi:NAD(P)/FAD-dependent oxidoreductase [Pseudomonas sp. HK3]